jgi:hypothetical protein
MTEHEIALREDAQNAASDAYFGARQEIDTNDRRKVFEAGFCAAWRMQRNEASLPKRPEPCAAANTVGLEWDAYSGIQMLQFGRACADAQLLASSNTDTKRLGRCANERTDHDYVSGT